MKMTKKIALAIVTTGLLAASSTALADMKVGIVNFMQVFQQAPQGNATLNQLKSQLQPQLDQMKQQQQELMSQAQALEKDGPAMTKTARAAKEKDLSQKQQAFQSQIDALRDSETKKEQAAASAFEGALQTAISQVAQNGHYDLVMTSQATPYYSPSYDITASVVKIMQGNNSSK